jgi:hypothetical protein
MASRWSSGIDCHKYFQTVCGFFSFTTLCITRRVVCDFEGHLDSDASLEIISNHGRGRQEIALHSPQIAIATGGGEEWVDDLQVEYHPNAAKAGQLYVSIYCGKNLTPDDATRFNQIKRTQ